MSLKMCSASGPNVILEREERKKEKTEREKKNGERTEIYKWENKREKEGIKKTQKKVVKEHV